jgi:hypothetical protein
MRTTHESQTLDLVGKKAGKETMTIIVKMSADGKVQTATTTGMLPDGKTSTEVDVYDKQ